MSEMVERVSIALAKTHFGPQTTEAEYRVMAKAAIAAMREPTEEMIAAGHRVDPLACDVGEDEVAYCYGTMWRGMIDAALEERK